MFSLNSGVYVYPILVLREAFLFNAFLFAALTPQVLWSIKSILTSNRVI